MYETHTGKSSYPRLLKQPVKILNQTKLTKNLLLSTLLLSKVGDCSQGWPESIKRNSPGSKKNTLTTLIFMQMAPKTATDLDMEQYSKIKHPKNTFQKSFNIHFWNLFSKTGTQHCLDKQSKKFHHSFQFLLSIFIYQK